MANQSDHYAPVTLEEFREMARIAGLNIAEERVPIVLTELNAQLALARTLDAVLAGVEAPLLAPYDPAFPPVRAEGSLQ